MRRLLFFVIASMIVSSVAPPAGAYYQQVASDSVVLSADGDTNEVTLSEEANWLILSVDSKAFYLTLTSNDATTNDLSITASETPLMLKGLEDIKTFNVKADGNNVQFSWMALRQN